MPSLDTIDLLIVAAFFIVVFLIGIIDRKKVKLEDYWVNNRKTNKFILVATTLSTFIGVGSILGLAGVTYSGAGFGSFVLVGSFFLYFLIFAKFFAPKIKEFGDRHNAYTLPDFLEFRYSKKVRVAGSLVNLITYGFWLALQMLGVGVFISTVGGFDPLIGTAIGGLIVIAYTSIGGLRADIRTDVVQFFVMSTLVIVFLPVLVINSGGLESLTNLPISFLAGTEFAPLYVFIFGFIFLGATNLTSSDIWQRAYAGDTTQNVKWAMKISSILVLLFLAMAVFFGIYGKILLPDVGPNNVVPELLNRLLPAGIFGLVLIGFFAAIMSSADTMLLITSMTIVHDIYQKTFNKQLSDEATLRASRWVTLVVGILSLAVALIVLNIVHLAIDAISFVVVLIPAIVFGFYWKKANSTAAFWSIVLGLVTITVFLFIDPIQAFIPGIIVSFLTFLIVNRFTKKITRIS